MSRRYEFVYAAVFSVLIFAAAAAFVLCPKQTFSEKEKRVLADMPAVSLTDGAFLKSADEYITDHFPARDLWIGVSAGVDMLLGRNGENGIYVGRDGYFFVAPADRRTDYTQANLQILKRFADENGLSDTLLLVPYAGYVLQDKLPYNHKAYFDIAADGKIDLTGVFRTSEKQVYYKTDHHWTTYGAYLAYREYCAYAGLEPLPPGAFEIETVPAFYGTSYAKAGLWQLQPDTLQLWHNPALSVRITIDGTEYTDFYFRQRLDTYDKYAVFFDENHGLVIVENDDAPAGALLVLKDSFANALVPFLSAHYSRIVMIDMRYYGFGAVSDIVKEYGVTEMLTVYGVDTFVSDKNLLKLK